MRHALPQPRLGGRKSSTGWVLSSAPTLSPPSTGPKAQKAEPHSLKSWSSCAGWNRLWKGPDYAPRREISAFGDGHAAERAVGLIFNFLECQPRAESAPSF